MDSETAKHTEGPWRVTWSGNEEAGLYFLHEARRNSHPEVNDANARLIAAAPELLKACKAVVRCADSSPYPSDTTPDERPTTYKIDGAWIDDIRAAIAKATGRQITNEHRPRIA